MNYLWWSVMSLCSMLSLPSYERASAWNFITNWWISNEFECFKKHEERINAKYTWSDTDDNNNCQEVEWILNVNHAVCMRNIYFQCMRTIYCMTQYTRTCSVNKTPTSIPLTLTLCVCLYYYYFSSSLLFIIIFHIYFFVPCIIIPSIISCFIVYVCVCG